MDEWIEQYRTELISGEELDIRTIAEIVQRCDNVDPRDIAIAQTLTSKDVRYLARWEIDQLIEASIGEDEVAAAAEARVARYTRMAPLLPEVYRLLRGRSNFSLRYPIHTLNDLVADFSTPPQRKSRRDKRHNDRLKWLSRVARAVQSTLDIVGTEAVDHDLASEYQTLLDASKIAPNDGRTNIHTDGTETAGTTTFEGLVASLRIVLAAVEIVSLDLTSPHPRRWEREANMTKADVVSRAYDFHVSCEGPPLVTTPGSEFSYLCSVIYEMCTGVPHQSLSGAIIRFARSRERKDEDDYQTSVQEDEAAFQSGDNFHSVRGAIRRNTEAAKWYLALAESGTLTPSTQEAALRSVESSVDAVLRLRERMGPFIVWSSQEPTAIRENWLKRFEEGREKERTARIELGKLRRSKRTAS